MCGGDGWRHCSCVLTPVYFSEQVRIWHGHLIRCTVAVRWRRPGGRCSSLGTADSGLPKHTLEGPDLASEPAPPPPPPALLMPRPWQEPWSKGGQCQCSHTALASWHSSVPLQLQTQVPFRPAGALGIIHKFLRGLFRLIVYKNQKWESAPTRILTINSHHTDFCSPFREACFWACQHCRNSPGSSAVAPLLFVMESLWAGMLEAPRAQEWHLGWWWAGCAWYYKLLGMVPLLLWLVTLKHFISFVAPP